MCIIWFCVKETNYFLEENVIVPHKWEEKARIEGLVGDEQIEKEHQKEMLAEKRVSIGSKATREATREMGA